MLALDDADEAPDEVRASNRMSYADWQQDKKTTVGSSGKERKTAEVVVRRRSPTPQQATPEPSPRRESCSAPRSRAQAAAPLAPPARAAKKSERPTEVRR